MKLNITFVRVQINEKLAANDKLDASIMDASVAVAQREQISAMQKTAADKDGMARRYEMRRL